MFTHAGLPPTSEPGGATLLAPPRKSGANPIARARRRPDGRLAALDGIRFVAALSVVLFHFVQPDPRAWGGTNPFPDAYQLFGYGQFGVDLFFIASGFVICMSAWGRSLSDFAVSRAVRLYPLYWVSLLICAAVMLGTSGIITRMSGSDVLTNFTLFQLPLGTSGLNDVTWTLWFELHFYLLFSIVVWRGLTYRRVLTFCVLWLVAATITSAFPDTTVWLFLVDPPFAPYFVAGVILYLMHRFRPNLLLWLMLGGTWLLAQHYLLLPEDGRVHWSKWQPDKWGLLLALAVIYLMVAAVALGWTQALRWRWLTTCGLLTYPLYLIHLPVGLVLMREWNRRYETNAWVLVAVVVSILVAVSYVLQRWVEQPIARWLRGRLKTAIAQTRDS